ncbi:MAG: hypothetical protein ACRBFS_24440 [Aureispira sp.]
MPNYYPGPDVLQIVVETVNSVSGLVEQVKVIRKDGKIEIVEVAKMIVVSVNIFYRFIAWLDRLFRKH